ncbi:H/ACA RNA-protein complex protein Gar1 [Metallosphaera tengchongensis]|uniref:H/ACA RNA-protein complex protein Gar1 n=1 Tax=Metallosphaera tengchongensis TaxID=1532350 RepID=A0A6N0NTZ5_9CREN|nr:H/ACA RNA-protein complex protein Gar1 [Metallosphaera tengchongensis]QKQ99372.1 H/ACA RNA-protein complex protein Gar1 [Metallosphaera tengchongensis]
MGSIKSVVLKDKWLIEANPSIDYSKKDPSGLVVLDSSKNRVGKVLDVIGNQRRPYLLVEPLQDQVPKGQLLLEMPFKKSRR